MLEIVPELVQRKPYEGFTKNSLNQQVVRYGELEDVEVGVDQATNQENPNQGSAERAQADYVLYVNPRSAVNGSLHAQDRWVVRNVECFVVGRPELVRNMFTGEVFHTEVNVRRVEG